MMARQTYTFRVFMVNNLVFMVHNIFLSGGNSNIV